MTKVVILAGGYGTRLSEETSLKPKPMVEISGKPILWHIMKYYAAFGYNDFIICAGYKQYIIKEYFANYNRHNRDMTFDLGKGTMTAHTEPNVDWKVTVIDTGIKTGTGARLRKIADFLPRDEPFMMTYGDGLSDVNLTDLMAHHKKQKTKATLTAVMPPPRFGELDIENGMITSFAEKTHKQERLINGGYMVMEPDFLNYIDDDNKTMLEQEPLRKAAENQQLSAFEHRGFWQCMDKLYDKKLLEDLWSQNQAPWKIW